MRSTLVELGPWPPWVAVLLAALGAALLLYTELRSARAARSDSPAALRLLIAGLIGAAFGVGIFLAINHFGPVKVRSWGTMLMLGFALALAWTRYAIRNDELVSFETMIDLCIVVLIGSIIGARLLSAALDWGEYAGHPERLLRVWEGGLSFHGGLIGGWLAGSILTVRRRIPYGHMVDIVAPAVAIGYAVTRLGCFLNGCCYGAPTDLPWGVRFPELPPPDCTIPRHPTQLYASAAMTAIFFLLLAIKPHLRREGHLGLVFLALYSVYRFAIEYLRRGATAHAWGPVPALTHAQAASIAMFIVAGGWLLLDWLLNRPIRRRSGEVSHHD